MSSRAEEVSSRKRKYTETEDEARAVDPLNLILDSTSQAPLASTDFDPPFASPIQPLPSTSNPSLPQPASLYSIFPDLSPFDPVLPFAPTSWTYNDIDTQPPLDPFSDAGIVGSVDQPPFGLDPTGFDTHSLHIDSTHTFWSAWQSTLADQSRQAGRSESFGSALPLLNAVSLSGLDGVNELSQNAQPNQPIDHDPRPQSRAASPAFFETDRLGQSLSKWNMYYDAARDDGDVLRGHRQIFLDEGATTGMTVDALKRRWPILERFTFDHRSKSRIVEAVLFSGISQSEQQAVYRTLARLMDAVYLHFFSLYFLHVHFVNPFLHLPTLDPGIDNGLLSLAIIAVGAFYSEMPNARQFAIIMLEIVRRGCERIMTSNPKSSRDIQAIQALLLANISRGGGEGREMETYERYRSFCCTVLRRVMGFQSLTMPVPPTRPDGTEHACWRAWIRWEQLKRTALVCFSRCPP